MASFISVVFSSSSTSTTNQPPPHFHIHIHIHCYLHTPLTIKIQAPMASTLHATHALKLSTTHSHKQSASHHHHSSSVSFLSWRRALATTDDTPLFPSHSSTSVRGTNTTLLSFLFSSMPRFLFFFLVYACGWFN